MVEWFLSIPFLKCDNTSLFASEAKPVRYMMRLDRAATSGAGVAGELILRPETPRFAKRAAMKNSNSE
jgi:hypothetical protein